MISVKHPMQFNHKKPRGGNPIYCSDVKLDTSRDDNIDKTFPPAISIHIRISNIDSLWE